jgi:hypothetical protein
MYIKVGGGLQLGNDQNVDDVGDGENENVSNDSDGYGSETAISEGEVEIGDGEATIDELDKVMEWLQQQPEHSPLNGEEGVTDVVVGGDDPDTGNGEPIDTSEGETDDSEHEGEQMVDIFIFIQNSGI